MGDEYEPTGWRRDHHRPLMAFPQIPGAFVRLGHDAVGEVVDDGQIEVTQPLDASSGLITHHNSIRLLISRQEAIAYGLVEPTPEEQAEMAARHEAFKVAEAKRRTEPGPPLTLDAILELLGWPAEFAEHLLHPACYCTVTLTDDPALCRWATELGWEWSWGHGEDEDGPGVIRRD